VSHQLPTPLTVIRVYGEMFDGGMLGKLTYAQTTHIARMTNASIRLIKLIDDILNVSRIEIGNYHIKRNWLDLYSLIRYSPKTVAPLAEVKHITLTFSSHTTTYIQRHRNRRSCLR
jgi:signal transduction histidine kinase